MRCGAGPMAMVRTLAKPESNAAPPLTGRSEQSRARYPDETGFVERDGVRVAWERYGDGSPTILLLPTWSIIHSRHWKAQIPYLARHFRVVTFDGRGNGRSDRPQTSPAHDGSEFVADAVAVLDATSTDQAVIAGLSMGGGYALRLSAEHPERVLGAVFIGPAVDVGGGEPDPDRVDRPFEEDLDYRDDPWARYNAHAWRRDWPGFTEWFFSQVFSEPHSTKQIEDCVGWSLDTDPETIIVAERSAYMTPPADFGELPSDEAPAMSFARRVRCPSLVIHGSDDRIIPIDMGRRLAKAIGADLVVVEGGGHAALARDPVLVNLLIRKFVASLGETP
jgi:pimeloyl-ACP methyl ester carboxylesterase